MPEEMFNNYQQPDCFYCVSDGSSSCNDLMSVYPLCNSDLMILKTKTSLSNHCIMYLKDYLRETFPQNLQRT